MLFAGEDEVNGDALLSSHCTREENTKIEGSGLERKRGRRNRKAEGGSGGAELIDVCSRNSGRIGTIYYQQAAGWGFSSGVKNVTGWSVVSVPASAPRVAGTSVTAFAVSARQPQHSSCAPLLNLEASLRHLPTFCRAIGRSASLPP